MASDSNANGAANGEKKSIKVLFVSFEGLIGDLAWQIHKEGHEVKYFISEKSEKDVCDGFVDKCDDWKPLKDWADLIIFDDINFGGVADGLRKEGKAVVGGSAYADKLEDDRDFGQFELKKAGINILPNWNFTDFDEAIKFVQSNPARYVIKPNGSAQNEKELLFIGQEEDGNDIVNVLLRYKKSWSKKLNNFQLQKFVQGVEVAVGAFFNGKDFVYPINVNFEHKRMFSGGLGPNTGEMGTLMFWSPGNKLFNETLAKMKPYLAASGYVGYVDLNCIVNAKGIYPLEFTSRFGYPTISIQMEGVISGWGDFLHQLALGQNAELRTKKGFQIGVVIAVPPFPFTDQAAFKRYSEDAIIIFKKPSFDGVHLGDVKFVDGDWRLAGQSGYSLIVTGSGITVEEAQKQAYKRIDNILIPNLFYRTDIGNRWVRDSDMLHTWGYLY
ncbi:MAG: phosphoribosylamine--glycine ligase [Candidatus Micrarchaeota archaeon]|nr:phosphoribosylamine--glycine ligase [Candidatus Micrarchaeota archaeon]